jgi:tetratricopeptide (TPR) repeat protein
MSESSKVLERAAGLAAAKQFVPAERLVREVLSLSSDDFKAWYLLGMIQAHQADHESALASFDEALRRHHQSPQVWASRAESLVRLRRPMDAVVSYDVALGLQPQQCDWWHLRGTALVELRRFEAALESFERALVLDGTRVQTISARGVALEGLGRSREAADCYRRALVLAPGYATAHSNLGRLQRESGDVEGALASFRAAVSFQPEFALAHHNLGCTLYDSNDLPAAIASYRRALVIAPQFAECEYSLATALLKSEDFAAGWKAFEARLRLRQHATLPAPPGLEPWSGEALGNKTLLILAEAGAGDTLQFTRYAALLNARGIRPELQIHPRLCAIVRSCGYFGEIHPTGQYFAPDRHVWCSLMSLPFRLAANAIGVASPGPYLRAESSRVERWRARLRAIGGFRIGIVWQGNPEAEIGSLRGRSMPAEEFAPLAAMPEVSLISLQQGAGTEQLESLSFRERVVDLGAELDVGSDGFVDTAAVMMNLDLVIATDTSVAHLAGALGVRVWVALHATSDWRWFQSRDDSPWYPTMRLFRQDPGDKWRGVMTHMRDRIQSGLAMQDRAGNAGSDGRAPIRPLSG